MAFILRRPGLTGQFVVDDLSGATLRAGGRKIRQSSSILTVHAATNISAHRASANGRRAPYRDHEVAIPFGRALNDKPARNKLRNIKPLHGSDPLPESKPIRRFDFIKSESEPILDADPGLLFDAD